ncbi:hypothetical protein L249_7849 [Ophiocordyceps polyrhachis-furcata BCC 54312]|uniref:Uncharacterized protein n=1 Tax=Ophiocordyceps polyrhachis-furcata BCC 54312 TaxID=1330021 RepID=A0A367L0U2_9HYPO|nr:hypothetical protein L249_7849 [Ophiocordyceps polyrhachis-furcata BCC 54312]
MRWLDLTVFVWQPKEGEEERGKGRGGGGWLFWSGPIFSMYGPHLRRRCRALLSAFEKAAAPKISADYPIRKTSSSPWAGKQLVYPRGIFSGCQKRSMLTLILTCIFKAEDKRGGTESSPLPAFALLGDSGSKRRSRVTGYFLPHLVVPSIPMPAPVQHGAHRPRHRLIQHCLAASCFHPFFVFPIGPLTEHAAPKTGAGVLATRGRKEKRRNCACPSGQVLLEKSSKLPQPGSCMTGPNIRLSAPVAGPLEPEDGRGLMLELKSEKISSGVLVGSTNACTRSRWRHGRELHVNEAQPWQRQTKTDCSETFRKRTRSDSPAGMTDNLPTAPVTRAAVRRRKRLSSKDARTSQLAKPGKELKLNKSSPSVLSEGKKVPHGQSVLLSAIDERGRFHEVKRAVMRLHLVADLGASRRASRELKDSVPQARTMSQLTRVRRIKFCPRQMRCLTDVAIVNGFPQGRDAISRPVIVNDGVPLEILRALTLSRQTACYQHPSSRLRHRQPLISSAPPRAVAWRGPQKHDAG